jgi:hypothetical protein
MIKTTTLTFEAAQEACQIDGADYCPFAMLNAAGQNKVRAFADFFYEEEDADGVVNPGCYDEQAVFSHFTDGAECLLMGDSHVVEIKRVNRGMFGGFKVDSLQLTSADFDWVIHGRD